MDYSITYSGEPPVLEGYSDASWITNEEDNSSASGWLVVYGGGVISWSSKKQTCITDSLCPQNSLRLHQQQMKQSS